MSFYQGIRFKIYIRFLDDGIVETWNGACTDDQEPSYVSEIIETKLMKTDHQKIQLLVKMNTEELKKINKEISRIKKVPDNELVSNMLDTHYELKKHIVYWLTKNDKYESDNKYKIESESGIHIIYVNGNKMPNSLSDTQKYILEFMIEQKKSGKVFVRSDEMRSGRRFESVSKVFRNNKVILDKCILYNNRDKTYQLK